MTFSYSCRRRRVSKSLPEVVDTVGTPRPLPYFRLTTQVAL